MDSPNRFERRSLRDVLVAQGFLTDELADELVNSAREENEPFGAVVVEAGHLTAWDLAKIVTLHYNMPCLPLHEFTYDAVLADGLPAATLYQYQVLPVGRFGKARSFAVVEPPSRTLLDALTESCGSHLFFFVAEAPEIRRLLSEHVKVVDPSADASWQDVFDAAEENLVGDKNDD